MKVELDHIFVCTGVGAPEAVRLVEFGLVEGTSNPHPGQGTTNRRFFFHNAYLELLWVRDEREARSPPIAPTRLWERWRHRSTAYSPFGLCVRPSPPHARVEGALPFRTWEYRPPYLPPGSCIDVATGTSASEPLLFAVPYAGRPDTFPDDLRQPLVHPSGVVEISALRVTLPAGGEPMSGAVRELHREGVVSFDTGDEHLAEIELDHGARGQSADFRPFLPLRFRW